MHTPVLLAFLLSWFAATALQAQTTLNGKGTLWSPYLEWSVNNTNYTGNPFDLDATAKFVHKGSNETRTTHFFYAGGTTWKVRFAATRVGTWTVTTRSPDKELHGLTGTITIGPNPNPNVYGFLTKVVGSDGTKWARFKGNRGDIEAFVPQLLIHSNDIGNGFGGRQVIRQRIAEFFGRHGFNGFHVQSLGGKWFDIKTSERVTTAMQNPDPRTFDALEVLIRETHAAGGIVHLWPWGDHARRWTPLSLKGGINGAQERRLTRYMAARLGPVVGWSMGYGFDLDEWVSAAQVKTWRDYFAAQLGWEHPLGGRPAGPNSGTNHSKWLKWNQPLDYASYEHHEPDYKAYVAAITNVAGKPAFSEDRFRIEGLTGPGKDYTLAQTRRGLWHSTMAGGVANIWGNLTRADGRVINIAAQSWPYPNATQLRTYSMFFAGRCRFAADLQRISLGSGMALRGSKGRHHVLYAEDVASLQVDLSKMTGAQRAIAVDTKKAYREINLGSLAAKQQTIMLPHKTDWAIAIGSPDGACQRGRWQDLGSALPGSQGTPILQGVGDLWPKTEAFVELKNAAANAPCLLALSTMSQPLPLFGGKVLAFPFAWLVPLTTNRGGALQFQQDIPTNAPANFRVYLQAAILDAKAIQGVALSNALLGLGH